MWYKPISNEDMCYGTDRQIWPIWQESTMKCKCPHFRLRTRQEGDEEVLKTLPMDIMNPKYDTQVKWRHVLWQRQTDLATLARNHYEMKVSTLQIKNKTRGGWGGIEDTPHGFHKSKMLHKSNEDKCYDKTDKFDHIGKKPLWDEVSTLQIKIRSRRGRGGIDDTP